MEKIKSRSLFSFEGQNLPRVLLNSEFGSRDSKACLIQNLAEQQLLNKDEHDVLSVSFPESNRSTFLMVFNPSKDLMASTHGDHHIYINRVCNGSHVQTLKGHPRTPWTLSFHPSQYGVLASGCLGGHVRVWDLSGGSELWIGPGVISSLSFHPLDRLLVIASTNELFFWDWDRKTPFTKAVTGNPKEKIQFVKFDKLGHNLITGIYNPSNEIENRSRYSEPRIERGFSSERRRPTLLPNYGRRSNIDSSSASQTLSDLAAAASSQLEAENAATPRANESQNDHENEEEFRFPTGDHAYYSSRRRPFNHSPESSFVEVPLPRRIRESDDLTSARELFPSSFGSRPIDEWAVNRRISLESSRLTSENPTPGPSSSQYNTNNDSIEDRENTTTTTTDPRPAPSSSSSSSLLLPPSDNVTNSSEESHLNSSEEDRIVLLNRHIEHMQQICRTSLRDLTLPQQRRRILRLQAIRRMLEDLHHQIRSLRELSRSEVSNVSSFGRRGVQSSSYSLEPSILSRSSRFPRFPLRIFRRSSSLRLSRHLVSQLHATFRALELSPDLSRSAHNNAVHEYLAEESRIVMERTESRNSRVPELSTQGALRALSQRLERVIRDRREAEGSWSHLLERSQHDSSSESEGYETSENFDSSSRRTLGRPSLRERLELRAGLRRNLERIRSRLSRERDIFQRHRDSRLEMEDFPSASSSSHTPSSLLSSSTTTTTSSSSFRPQFSSRHDLPPLRELIWRRLHRRNLHSSTPAYFFDEEDSRDFSRHRALLSWMVENLSIEQQSDFEGGPPRPLPRSFRLRGILRDDYESEPSESLQAPNYFLSNNAHNNSSHNNNINNNNSSNNSSSHNNSGNNGNGNGNGNSNNSSSSSSNVCRILMTYRLQSWDFLRCSIPDLSQRNVNIIVREAKILNDASVDISENGNLLASLVSSHVSNSMVIGVYSISPSTLGQIIANISLESSPVSLSLSPSGRHLLVGLKTRALTSPSENNNNDAHLASIFEISSPSDLGGSSRGRLFHVKDLNTQRSETLTRPALNCIRWIPIPGNGFVYATNTGTMKILR